MASKKFRRYGQGGSKHKHTPNTERPNGKSWKQHPKAFDYSRRGLSTVGQDQKGESAYYL